MQQATVTKTVTAKNPLTQDFVVWEVTRIQPITGDVICSEVYTPTLVEAYMNHEYTVCIEQNNRGNRTLIFVSEYLKPQYASLEVFTTKAEVIACLEVLR